jgi:hypothetical protein
MACETFALDNVFAVEGKRAATHSGWCKRREGEMALPLSSDMFTTEEGKKGNEEVLLLGLKNERKRKKMSASGK